MSQDKPNRVLLTPLTVEHATAEWPVLAKFLEKAIPYAAGRYTLEDVEREVKRGEEAMVFIVWNPSIPKLLAVIVAIPERSARKRIFKLALCGGEDLASWSHLWPAFCEIARKLGFDQIEVTGRPGWGRFLKGAREVYRAWVQDLDEPQELAAPDQASAVMDGGRA